VNSRRNAGAGVVIDIASLARPVRFAPVVELPPPAVGSDPTQPRLHHFSILGPAIDRHNSDIRFCRDWLGGYAALRSLSSLAC
jgi:hypothetical protein